MAADFMVSRGFIHVPAAPGQHAESAPGRLLQLAGELFPAQFPEFLIFNHKDLKQRPRSSLKFLSYRAASRICPQEEQLQSGVAISVAAMSPERQDE